MREPVKCKNCGIKWLRVTTFGTDTVLIENLQYLCPNCHSNWCEPEPEKRNPYPQVIIDEASEIADAGADAERARIVGLFDEAAAQILVPGDEADHDRYNAELLEAARDIIEGLRAEGKK